MKMVNRNWLTELRGNESQEVVADRAGVSRSNYTNIENGLRSPSVDTAKKIAGALNFEWTRFFN
ncbi:helix-turn-helix transcriptional regulator [Paenibacillus sinopodophylli]|uniref:helix-turn-helix transcriptional regulator n=1 Tax=Paenibacillus sinopodophylli TaxID=1837342 RepID=UPI00319EA433